MAQPTLTATTERNRATISGAARDIFSWIPKRAFFEREALEYPLGKRIFELLKELGVEILFAGSHNRITGIPGKTPREAYLEGKRTLVVGIRKTMDFQSCKPSAHYQLPLVTSCPGMCEYCYLNTTLGKKPYIRIYVNTEDILNQAGRYIESGKPEITSFEGAATSDPLPVEPFSGALARAIEFFGGQEYGRFRFVTKFTNVETLLNLEHRGHTRVRFSINARSVIEQYEGATPRLVQRLNAARQIFKAGYPLGFIIGPIMIFDGWQQEYAQMFEQLKERFGTGEGLTLELITHRFTKKAKANILEVFPETTLPMEETGRKFKFGQFGYGKYVYSKEDMEELKSFFESSRDQLLPEAIIDYFV